MIHLKRVGNSLVISELPLSRYIWILGSSIILHAEKHSKSRFTGHNLGLQVLGYSVLWAGISGMRWDELVPIVHSMTNCFGIPKMVLIHCGGNDIGIDPCGKLLFHLKFAVYVISKMLPGSMIAYSNILPRRTWRYSNNTDAMERTRKRLNRGLRTYLLQNNSCAIAHPDFDDSYSALYDDDGVHLSFIGKDIFINTIQEALFQFLRYPNCNVYPMEHMSVD